MNTLGPNGMKALKILHILFGIMWIGGVMALVCIMLGSQPEGMQQIYMAARDHLVIDKWFLIPGGFGIVFTALAYSIFTKWGFFKFNWVTVKWVLTLLLVIIGKVYMGVLIERNIAIADGLLAGIGSAKAFYTNVSRVATAGIFQLIGFAVILVLSVIKPWNKSKIHLTFQTLIPLILAIVFHAVGKILHLRDEVSLFYPGVVFFLLGHIGYLYVIIRWLGRVKTGDVILLLIPPAICWIPALAMAQSIHMALVVSLVMLSIFLYIASGTAGLLRKRPGYLLILLGGICFLVSDAITGTSSTGALTTGMYLLSQAAFYWAEILIICGIVKTSASSTLSAPESGLGKQA